MIASQKNKKRGGGNDILNYCNVYEGRLNSGVIGGEHIVLAN